MNFNRKLHFTILALVVVVVFHKTIDNFFIADDIHWIKLAYLLEKNFLKAILTTPEGYWRPITLIIYSINFHFFNFNPVPYYLTIIFLHIGVVFLVYIFTTIILKEIFTEDKNNIALYASFVFAVMYSHYPAVIFIAAVNDSLSTFFYLTSIIFFILFLQNKKIIYIVISNLSFIFAMLSKESSFTLPFVILFTYFLFSNKKITAKDVIKKISIYFLILFAYIPVYQTIAPYYKNPHRTEFILGFHFIKNIYTCLSEFPLSIFGIVRDNFFHYGHTEKTKLIYDLIKILQIFQIVVFGLIFLFIVLYLIFYREKIYLWFNSKLKTNENIKFLYIISFCILWIIITFLPNSFFNFLIIPQGAFFAKYRYLYLPSVGFSIMFGIFFYLWIRFIERIGASKIKVFIYIFFILIISINSLQNFIMISKFKSFGEGTRIIFEKVRSIVKNDSEINNLYLVDFPESWKFFSVEIETLLDMYYERNWSIIWIRKEEFYKKKNILKHSIHLKYENYKIEVLN